MSLPTLLYELHLLILNDLSTFEKQMLHLTCRTLYHKIPQQVLSPTAIRMAETTSFARTRNLLYCNSCQRLRWAEKFSSNEKGPQGRKSRFCLPCALRPLVLGESESEEERRFKYMPGHMWTDPGSGLKFVRGWCERCEKCTALPFEMDRLAEFPWMVCEDCLPGFGAEGVAEERTKEYLVRREKELAERWWEEDKKARRVREEEEGHGAIQTDWRS